MQHASSSSSNSIDLFSARFIFIFLSTGRCIHLLNVLVILAPFKASAFYPLTSKTRGRDLSVFGNSPGKLGYVRSAPGPDTFPGGSYQFFGRRDSYIEFPNRGKLDTRTSITILAWIYHEGRAGPIFNYMPNGWGVHLWMVSPRTLFVRYTRRRGRKQTAALSSRQIKPRTWQYIAATYDYITRYAKLYLDGKVIAQRRIGRIRLATNYPVRMGARRGGRRYFRGRISCVMVFDVALNPNQIARRKKRCFRGEFCVRLSFFCMPSCLSVLSIFVYVCLSLCFCLLCLKSFCRRL